MQEVYIWYMRKGLLFFGIILGSISSNIYAQNVSYPGRYYSISYDVNGFRSVNEENALMEQVVAERRRKARLEERLPADDKGNKGNNTNQPVAAPRIKENKDKQVLSGSK